MSKIKKIRAREILDSRGFPTVEVEVETDQACGRADVPSGASTGAHEAHELRDNDQRFGGKGVLKAIENVQKQLAPQLLGMDVEDQRTIDEKLIQLDGTENKSRLGANALLGVSLAAARASAHEKKESLFKSLLSSLKISSRAEGFQLPVPLMNVLNGGAHADTGVDVQEFMIIPMMETFSESLRAGSEVFHALKKILVSKNLSTGVGDEGGVAPQLKSNREALDLISEAVVKAGYKLGKDIYFALDVAATELFENGKYRWENRQLSPEELMAIYGDWVKNYPLLSIEDGFAEDDWDSWTAFTKQYGKQLQIVGDDLFVTNAHRIMMGIERKAANALLVKCNQIGTLTETWEAIHTAREKGNFRTVMSHRSGETEDPIIADLAVGLGCEQIKTGSLCRSERIAKYNQLLRIEEELGKDAQYWGLKGFAR